MVQPRFTAARIIAAIADSDGIKSVIYGRVPCSATTLDRWLSRSPTVAAAYEDECNKMLGAAQSVVIGNIQAARRTQKKNKGTDDDGVQVDSGDAKWFLTKKGKHLGFGSDEISQEVHIGITLGDWRKRHKDRRKQVEDL